MNTYDDFEIGTKVGTSDSHGYPIVPLCGTIEKHLGDGHAIIKAFHGNHYSTVGYTHRISEVELAAPVS